MKYIIAMFGDQNTMMETRSPEWIRDMIGFMKDLDQEIRDAGEFVDGQGLVDPSEAKTVRLQDGVPVATDGPYAEAKESLAGWWIIEADEARDIGIASRCVGVTGEPCEGRTGPD